jgi:glutaryl-CoA dehydrogenase
MTAKTNWAAFNWEDPFLLESQLTEEERLVRDTANAYAQEKLAPRVREAYQSEQTDPTIFREMGELGLMGPTIQGYGCSGVSYVA